MNAISIHAAREGGDVPHKIYHNFHSISIHAAREGGDAVRYESVKIKNISIHAAREGGDVLAAAFNMDKAISIHAAREGGDLNYIVKSLHVGLFQSTPPVKAATAETYKCNQHFRKQQVRK